MRRIFELNDALVHEAVFAHLVDAHAGAVLHDEGLIDHIVDLGAELTLDVSLVGFLQLQSDVVDPQELSLLLQLIKYVLVFTIETLGLDDASAKLLVSLGDPFLEFFIVTFLGMPMLP